MRKFFFILSALMLLWRAETTSAASLDDFNGVWIFSPKETHAFLVETKSPFLAEFDQQKFGDTEELRLRIDMANKYLSFIFVKEPDIGLTIQFTGTELKDNSLTISWEHESKTFSKTFTLVSDTVLSSSNLMWEQAPPIAFTKEKQAARQVDEAMLKRISGTWGPKDSNDWMLRVERQAGFDSDGVIRFIMVEVIDEKGKLNHIDRRVPFRLASSTGDTAVLHLLPAPPATVFSLYGSAMANIFLKDDLKIHFLQANIVEITSPELNELVLRKR